MEKLSPLCKHAMEEAAVMCVNQQNAEITVAHILFVMLDTPYSDLRIILDQTKCEQLELKNLLGQSIANSKQNSVGNYPSFSPLLIELLQDSWLLACTEYQHAELRCGVFFLSTLLNANRYLTPDIVQYLSVINRETLRNNFAYLTMKSVETPQQSSSNKAAKNAVDSALSVLEKYTTNFTQMATDKALDPVLCRDDEIALMIDILCRRRKNNPIVVGDAGVGKSAVIEGLAQRIIDGTVPSKLQNVELLSLDLGALQAGASVKGEFEKRLKGVIEEVKGSDKEVILFIDEAHTLIGAGNQEGGGDAANLMKPALARGELRCIGATTWKEYKKYFEKDPALTRRFQLVKLDEPSIEQAIHILRGLSSVYEQEHQVLISDDALQAAAQFSARYISGRQLPDKAIDVLDTACARLSINLSSRPNTISRLENEIRQHRTEIERLKRQQQLGVEVDDQRIEQLGVLIQQISENVDKLASDWSSQQKIVSKIIELRQQLVNEQTSANQTAEETKIDTQPHGETNKEAAYEDEELIIDLLPQDKTAAIQLELIELNNQLEGLQSTHILANAFVDSKQIASVIGDWTGIPINQMSTDQLTTITQLPQLLTEQIKGQEIALAKIHRHLLTARADLRKTGRPQGAFLLVGPSGVGKTETVIQLTKLLYGGKQFLTTINMSEYQEKHTVSRLIGSPPGYVGFGEGGVLSEAIRQKPYSVVLLDEVEKAHPEVLNLFYQAFDKGELADGEGRLIDCQNIIFFMTSNLGYQTIVDFADQPAQLDEQLYPQLADFFKPALLARMETVPYLPLQPAILKTIIKAKMKNLQTLLADRYKAEVQIAAEVTLLIRERADRSENGARMIESVIDGQLLPSLSLQILERLAAKQSISLIKLDVHDGQFSAGVA
jgi:type VI secretion system protein VasG